MEPWLQLILIILSSAVGILGVLFQTRIKGKLTGSGKAIIVILSLSMVLLVFLQAKSILTTRENLREDQDRLAKAYNHLSGLIITQVIFPLEEFNEAYGSQDFTAIAAYIADIYKKDNITQEHAIILTRSSAQLSNLFTKTNLLSDYEKIPPPEKPTDWRKKWRYHNTVLLNGIKKSKSYAGSRFDFKQEQSINRLADFSNSVLSIMDEFPEDERSLEYFREYLPDHVLKCVEILIEGQEHVSPSDQNVIETLLIQSFYNFYR